MTYTRAGAVMDVWLDFSMLALELEEGYFDELSIPKLVVVIYSSITTIFLVKFISTSSTSCSAVSVSFLFNSAKATSLQV